MDIFEYLRDEERLILDKLQDLVHNFGTKSRETVFDDVKLMCDKLRGYSRKQTVLLLDKIEGKNDQYATELKETEKQRNKLSEELDNMLMVHVDEPGYKEYLSNILRYMQTYAEASDSLYRALERAKPPEIGIIDNNLQTAIHSDVGFNSLVEH
jgi:cell division septum initiation protein DivIVA